MNQNYYEILGVAESASQNEIKIAYRQMAMKYHPDRGGSHEKMIEINEAFEILYGIKSRHEYDFARAHQNDVNAQKAAERTTRATRAEAGNYPREWNVFEKWLNSLATDFNRAEYGHTHIHHFPTAGYSITGWIFIIIGGYIGGFIVTSLGFGQKFAMYIGLLAGASIGASVHSAIKAKMSQTPPTQSTPPHEDKKIVECPNCTQLLRVSDLNRQIKIKCTTCSNIFTHP